MIISLNEAFREGKDHSFLELFETDFLKDTNVLLSIIGKFIYFNMNNTLSRIGECDGN